MISTSRRGFTLTEILVATTILGMAVSMTMVVYLAALRRAKHSEDALKGTAELRYATDMISQAVRSSPLLPEVDKSGLRLLVSPKDQPLLVVTDGTWIDAAHTTKGFKASQQNMHVALQVPVSVRSVFKATDRPTGSVSGAQVGTYFTGAVDTSTWKVSDYLEKGDSVRIPATAFAPEVKSKIVDSISKNAGEATITYTQKLTVDVPQGTVLTVTSGRRQAFEVVGVTVNGKPTANLVFYPDADDLTKFTILARDIATKPLADPADTTGTTSVPFVIPATSPNYVVLNLQKLPRGGSAGRTLQGIRTTVFTRNDTQQP